MIGPKDFPTKLVPALCIMNNPIKIVITMGTVLRSSRPSINLRPSMADETDKGGVIIPSANNIAPPMTVPTINCG
jgi:hypothetical protein